jgi:hypothetical protein
MIIIPDTPGIFPCNDCALRFVRSCFSALKDLDLPDCAENNIHFKDEPNTYDYDQEN